MKNLTEIITTVEKTLSDAHIHAEVYEHFGLPVVCVLIEWGDWKHDHLRADYLVEQLGGNLIAKEVVEEDDSDSYSAIHNYVFNLG